MAVVGPLRALFVARGQALFNQLRREAGGAGLAGAVIVAVAVPSALAAPAVGAYLVGSSLGAVIGHPERGARALLTLSGFFLFLPLGLGLLGGVLGGDEDSGLSLRPYPVSRRQRLAARLASSSVGLAPLLAFAGVAGLGVGLCVARPAFGPIALLLSAQGAAWTLIVQHLVLGLRSASLARLRFAVPALGAVSLAVALSRSGRPLLLGALGLLQQWLPYSPTTFGVEGLRDIASGQLALGWLRQLVPLAVTALAIEGTARLAARREEPEGNARRVGVAPERLWSFRAPQQGIALLFVSAVTRSREGLTLLFMPSFLAMMIVAVSSVIVEDLQRKALALPFVSRIPSLESLPIFGIVPFLVLHLDSELWLNQWGWDGRVVRTLFVVPIATRDLLLGKLRGLGAIGLAQLGMTAPVLALARGPRPSELLWGLGAGAFALVVMGGLGHVLSAGLSRPLDERGRTGRTESFASLVAGLLTLGAAGGPVLLVYGVSRHWGEWGPPIALWTLAAAGFAAYWQALPFLGRRVRDLRESFLEA